MHILYTAAEKEQDSDVWRTWNRRGKKVTAFLCKTSHSLNQSAPSLMGPVCSNRILFSQLPHRSLTAPLCLCLNATFSAIPSLTILFKIGNHLYLNPSDPNWRLPMSLLPMSALLTHFQSTTLCSSLFLRTAFYPHCDSSFPKDAAGKSSQWWLRQELLGVL